jgi:hypothetical protein
VSTADRDIQQLRSKCSIKDERRKWKNINNVDGRKNYRKLRNVMIGNAEKTAKKCLNNIKAR